MKKIIPFNNVLTFNTDVKEITAISLEHKINTKEDTINGIFYISGEYKITDGQLEKETFNFELPFDIALGSNYNLDTIIVDIDDFRYELIERNKLKVNIDLYIDGEIIEKEDIALQTEDIQSKQEEIIPPKEDTKEPILTPIQERLDILDEMIINSNKEETDELPKQDNTIDKERYVTYRVYTITNNDTLDSIIKKYNITKEELSKYNSLENINPGIKLIIPSVKENNDK